MFCTERRCFKNFKHSSFKSSFTDMYLFLFILCLFLVQSVSVVILSQPSANCVCVIEICIKSMWKPTDSHPSAELDRHFLTQTSFPCTHTQTADSFTMMLIRCWYIPDWVGLGIRSSCFRSEAVLFVFGGAASPLQGAPCMRRSCVKHSAGSTM